MIGKGILQSLKKNMQIISNKNMDNKFFSKNINKILLESDGDNVEDFKEALLNLATLDLEDDQVRIPKFDDETDSYIFQVGKTYIYVRNREELPSSGPFELFLLDVNDEVIGFIRGTKKGHEISFNLVYLEPERRGWGIGYDIYEYFLNNGYTIKSDSEITDGTYSLYLKLLKAGFKPLVFDDGRVGLTK
jgi:GNAT superfamily N-acetyltransferase